MHDSFLKAAEYEFTVPMQGLTKKQIKARKKNNAYKYDRTQIDYIKAEQKERQKRGY